MFDAEGNLWSGQNWMPGSQSGVIKSKGGGVVKLTPNGKPLPADHRLHRHGNRRRWLGHGGNASDMSGPSSSTASSLWMDFEASAVAKESDFPFKEKLLGLMGIGVAANGDVWIADG